jgi:hypothetical protein
MRATYPVHLINLDFITPVITYGAKYILNFFVYHLLHPSGFRHSPQSHVLKHLQNIRERDQISHPYKRTCKMIIIRFLLIKFLRFPDVLSFDFTALVKFLGSCFLVCGFLPILSNFWILGVPINVVFPYPFLAHKRIITSESCSNISCPLRW